MSSERVQEFCLRGCPDLLSDSKKSTQETGRERLVIYFLNLPGPGNIRPGPIVARRAVSVFQQLSESGFVLLHKNPFSAMKLMKLIQCLGVTLVRIHIQ